MSRDDAIRLVTGGDKRGGAGSIILLATLGVCELLSACGGVPGRAQQTRKTRENPRTRWSHWTEDGEV
ncbi:hypothetical protein CC86DRAFT_366811 [Ophiobolus disseminans]|uniref:Uncharacterized protein n=1 Tax=Ophiobolus disseminans TaxID=1469910 RepID=A0A6A7AFH4_9PLEO|nr:hypothetical protein CC86DRAFT_366811 [Ophiobolus disseminans]